MSSIVVCEKLGPHTKLLTRKTLGRCAAMSAYTPPEAPTSTASLSNTDVATDPGTYTVTWTELLSSEHTSSKWSAAPYWLPPAEIHRSVAFSLDHFNFAADCSILVRLGAEFDLVTSDVLQSFKVDFYRFLQRKNVVWSPNFRSLSRNRGRWIWWILTGSWNIAVCAHVQYKFDQK